MGHRIQILGTGKHGSPDPELRHRTEQVFFHKHIDGDDDDGDDVTVAEMAAAMMMIDDDGDNGESAADVDIGNST